MLSWLVGEAYAGPVGMLLGCLGMLVSLVVCRARATRQGYPGGLFGCLGLFLGIAMIPFTYLVTREATLNDRDADRVLSGRTHPQDVCACSRLASLFGTDSRAFADLLAWEDSYRNLRLSLLAAVLVLWMGLSFVLAALVGGLVPTLVVLFEGMSLQLPRATEQLYALVVFLHTPAGDALLLLLQWTMPVVSAALLLHTGYRLPAVGLVWKRLDRIWVLTAMQASSERWQELLPPEVRMRSGSDPLLRLDLPARIDSQELPSMLARERERLTPTLCLLLPVLVVLAGAALPVLCYVIVGVALPLYQLIAPVL